MTPRDRVFAVLQGEATAGIPFVCWDNKLPGGDLRRDLRDRGIRVPCIVSWPQGLPDARTVDGLTHFCDWQPTLVFVITGESNSGGIGLNADAMPDERKPRSAVQILNLAADPYAFEPLWIGKNNLREHAGLEAFYNTCHGLENGLAMAVESGAFAGHAQVYLVKTGQGGSRIAQWAPHDASGYWHKHVQRIEAARRALSCEPQWVVWFSLGINDGFAGTPVDEWQPAVIAHLRRIKEQLPGAVIVMTQFQSMKKWLAYDAAIAAIAGREPDVFAVDSTGTALRDDNHWNYAGFKTLAQRMVAATVKPLQEIAS